MIIIIGIPVYTFLLMVLGSCAIRMLMLENLTKQEFSDLSTDLVDMFSDWEWWNDIGITAIIAVVVQAIFVIPVLWKK